MHSMTRRKNGPWKERVAEGTIHLKRSCFPRRTCGLYLRALNDRDDVFVSLAFQSIFSSIPRSLT